MIEFNHEHLMNEARGFWKSHAGLKAQAEALPVNESWGKSSSTGRAREIPLKHCDQGHVMHKDGTCHWCMSEGVNMMTEEQLLMRKIDAIIVESDCGSVAK